MLRWFLRVLHCYKIIMCALYLFVGVWVQVRVCDRTLRETIKLSLDKCIRYMSFAGKEIKRKNITEYPKIEQNIDDFTLSRSLRLHWSISEHFIFKLKKQKNTYPI